MDDDAPDKNPHGASALPPNELRARYFDIAKRTDGRWEVGYSAGKHKRIYESLIDATAGAMEMAATDSSPYSIRIRREDRQTTLSLATRVTES
jgi:hypothetical protein